MSDRTPDVCPKSESEDQMTREEALAAYPPHHDGNRFHFRALGSEWQVYGHGLQHVCMCTRPELADMVAEALEAALREPVKEVPLPDSEPPDLRGPAIVISGGVIGGFKFTGPFATIHDADKWYQQSFFGVLGVNVAIDLLEPASPPPPASEKPTLNESVAAIYEAGGKGWDSVADPSAAIREMRGEPASGPTAADAANEIRQHGGPIEPIIQKAIDSATAELRKENERLRMSSEPTTVEQWTAIGEAERLLRLTCEHVCGTPVDEQSREIADISLAIDAATDELRAEIERQQSQLTAKGEEVERKLWLWIREKHELGGIRTAAEIAAEARRIVEGK